MNYIEIEKELRFQRNKYSLLQKEIRAISENISKLQQQYSLLEEEYFVQYIQLNEPITLTRFVSFSGIQTNVKSAESFARTGAPTGSQLWNPHFGTDDVIQVVKKNKKSIVIQCIKKKISKSENGKTSYTFVDPKTCFRINVHDFKSWYLSDKNLIERFKTWIKREQSLNNILGE